MAQKLDLGHLIDPATVMRANVPAWTTSPLAAPGLGAPFAYVPALKIVPPVSDSRAPPDAGDDLGDADVPTVEELGD